MSIVIFILLILLILVLDLTFHRKAHLIGFKEALIWSTVCVALALCFNIYIYFAMGQEAGINFLTGYLVEKSLSIDNLFVFLLIINYFKPPPETLHKVLFWGILGAIFTRGIFILSGVTLTLKFHWILYLFGIFLIYTGIKIGLENKQKINPEKNLLVKLIRYLFPVTKNYEGEKFFVRMNGKIFATPLFIVLISIEATDILFAVDSIPAILAITLDPFIVYTSNIFAIIGLRALFFVLSGALKIFTYLHYGIACILVFIGLKMLLSSILTINPFLSLGIICAILAVSIIPSFLKRKDQ